MTREELFPLQRYRVRKRTEFEVPGKRVKCTVELYFEESDGRLRGQWIGEYTGTASEDKTVRLAVAKIISPVGHMAYYIETRGVFAKILPENLMLAVRAFEKEFQEKYEIIITDPETDALISEALAEAQWEQF